MHQYISDFIALSFLEVILGVDNVIFISILVEQVKPDLRKKIRLLGVSLAVVLRVIALFCVLAITKMLQPLFYINDFAVTGQKILFVIGGLFLVFKASKETYSMLSEIKEKQKTKLQQKINPIKIVAQVVFIDLVLSLDSVVTAIGVTQHLETIIMSVIVSTIFMLKYSESVSSFIYNNVFVKIIALNFINIIGIFLTLNGFDITVSKNYLYFAIGVGCLNECTFILIKRKKCRS